MYIGNKLICSDVGANFHVMELNLVKNSSEIQDVLDKMTRAKTGPHVFFKTKFIGGGKELKQMVDHL